METVIETPPKGELSPHRPSFQQQQSHDPVMPPGSLLHERVLLNRTPITTEDLKTLVVHCCHCTEVNCAYPQCRYLKILVFHFSSCKEPEICSHCNEFTRILVQHKRFCVDRSCPFVSCRSNPSTVANKLATPGSIPFPHITSPTTTTTTTQHTVATPEKRTTPSPPAASSAPDNLKPFVRPKKQTPFTPRTTSQPLPIKWIPCKSCHHQRKVPEILDTFRIPHFECSLNIWDPPFSSCSIPAEEAHEGLSIDLNGNYLEYEQEKEEFMDLLRNFLKSDSGGVALRTPTLGRKEVDLYRLFREVTAYGGANAVVAREGTWAKIYRGMENFSPTETSASFRLKKMYNKYLSAFENQMFRFVDPQEVHTKPTPVVKQSKHLVPKLQKPINPPLVAPVRSPHTPTPVSQTAQSQQPWKCECGQENQNYYVYCTQCHSVVSTPNERRGSIDEIFPDPPPATHADEPIPFDAPLSSASHDLSIGADVSSSAWDSRLSTPYLRPMMRRPTFDENDPMGSYEYLKQEPLAEISLDAAVYSTSLSLPQPPETPAVVPIPSNIFLSRKHTPSVSSDRVQF